MIAAFYIAFPSKCYSLRCDQCCRRGLSESRRWTATKLHLAFTLSLLEFNNRHNLLYDSTLRNTRNRIDAASEVSKIKLPKQHHVVSNRASDTICCGFGGLVSPVFAGFGQLRP